MKKLVSDGCLFFILCSCLLVTSLKSEERGRVSLNEKDLLNILGESIDARLAKEDYREQLVHYLNDQTSYDWELKGMTELKKELQFIGRGLTYSENQSLVIGFSKKMSLGVDVFLGYQQYSNNFFSETAPFVRFSVDLSQNWAGRYDLYQSNKQKTLMQLKYLNYFWIRDLAAIEVMKAYWQYMALDLSEKIAREVWKSATEQLKIEQDKSNYNLSDEIDVARKKALESERYSQILVYQADKKLINHRLKTMLPDLNHEYFDLMVSEDEEILDRFRQCIDTIKVGEKKPTHWSYLDEMYALKESVLDFEVEMIELKNKSTIQLKSEFGLSDLSIESPELPSLNSENRYNLHLSIKKRLGDNQFRMKNQKITLLKNRLAIEKRRQYKEAMDYHRVFIDSIDLMGDALRNRNSAAVLLKSAIAESKDKYQQARISFEQYLQEEDRLFANEIYLINTKIKILNTLLNYFHLYPKTPCDLNPAMYLQSKGKSSLISSSNK